MPVGGGGNGIYFGTALLVVEKRSDSDDLISWVDLDLASYLLIFELVILKFISLSQLNNNAEQHQ